MRVIWGLALAVAMMLAGIGTRPAEAQTVDEIISRGTINIGVLVDLPPYGLRNSDQQPDGYDIDVAKLLGRYLGVKVNFVPLTGPNRIPFLVSGKVDLLIATFGITPERAKAVMFTFPYGAIDIVVFAGKAKAYAKIDDLKDARIGVPRGSAQDMLLTNTLGDNASIQRFEDDPSTYQALLSGKVDAIAETGPTGDEIYKKAGSDVGRKFTLVRQPISITMRVNQWNLHQWIDTFVFYVRSDGELDALYHKWFQTRLPPL